MSMQMRYIETAIRMREAWVAAGNDGAEFDQWVKDLRALVDSSARNHQLVEFMTYLGERD